MYKYSEEKEKLFTEEGQLMFISIRDNVKRLLNLAGAVRLQEAIANQTGSSWTMLACIDRLVEIEELIEIPTQGAAQYRIFIDNYRK